MRSRSKRRFTRHCTLKLMAGIIWLVMFAANSIAYAAPASLIEDPSWDRGANQGGDGLMSSQDGGSISTSSVPVLASGGLGAAENYVAGNKGDASYLVPISVPSGRAGLTPNLALTYSSASKERGALGVGWGLNGLGYIERRGSGWGSPTFSSTDIFVAAGDAGSGKLVADPDGAADHFRTEFDSLVRFVRYESQNKWEAFTRSGLVFEFDGSLGFLSGGSGSDFTSTYYWPLVRIRDINNSSNSIDFDWENRDGVPTPTRISYAGRTVDFIYQLRKDIVVSYRSGVRQKRDQILRQIVIRAPSADGDKVISGVTLSYNDPTLSPVGQYGAHITQSFLTLVQPFGVQFDTVGLPPYVFEYTKGTAGWTQDDSYALPYPFMIKSSAGSRPMDTGLRFGRVDADGKPDLILARSAENSTIDSDFGTPRRAIALNRTPNTDSTARWNIRTTGDQFPHDFAYVFDYLQYGQTYRATLAQGTAALDLTGDGLVDSIMGFRNYSSTAGDQRYFERNLVNGWEAAGAHPNALPVNVETTELEGSYYQDKGVEYGDFNGDGLTDFLQLERLISGAGNTYERALYLGTGSGSSWIGPFPVSELFRYQSQEQVTFTDCLIAAAPHIGCNTNSRLPLKVSDVNGDGLDDLIAFSSPTNYPHGPNGAVYLNVNGQGGFAPDTELPWTSNPIPPGYLGYRVVDLNNDNLPDILREGGAYLNLGHGWSPALSPEFAAPFDPALWQYVTLSDVNGDGLEDLILAYKEGNSFISHTYIRKGAEAGLLTSVTAPGGSILQFTYGSINDDSLHKDSEYPYSKSIVQQVSTDDGHGHLRTTDFTYFGGRFMADRFTGFRRIRKIVNATDPNTKQAVDDYFFTDSFLPGLLNYKVTSRDGLPDDYLNGANPLNSANLPPSILPISWTHNEYTFMTGPIFTPLTKTTEQLFKNGDLSAALDTISEYIFDPSTRTLTEERHYGADQPTPTNQRYYYASDSGYWLRLLCKSELKAANRSSGAGSGPVQHAESSYFNYSSTLCPTNLNGTLVTKVSVSDGASSIDQFFQYDSFGNLTCLSDSAGCQGSTTKLTYDPTYSVLPKTQTDPNGLVTTLFYDSYLRQYKAVLSSGVAEEVIFDNLNRVQRIKRDGQVLADTNYAPDGSWTENIRYLSDDNASIARVYQDGFGRPYYTEESTVQDGAKVCSGVSYDTLGRVIKRSIPIAGGCNPVSFDPNSIAGTEFHFNQEGDLIAVSHPDNTSEQTDFSLLNNQALLDGTSQTLLRVRRTNPTGTLEKSDFYDSAGQLRKVVEEGLPELPISYYEYDISGNLVTFQDPDANRSNFGFNTLGQNLWNSDMDISNCADPNNCKSQNIFNAKGQLYEQITPAGEKTRLHYDLAGNMRCLDRGGNAAEFAANADGCDCDPELDQPDSDPRSRKNSLPGLKDSCFLYSTELGSQANKKPNSGRLIKSVNANTVSTYSYNNLGQLATEDMWICINLNARLGQANQSPDVECRHSIETRSFNSRGLSSGATVGYNSLNPNYHFGQWVQSALGLGYDTRMRLSSLTLDGITRLSAISYLNPTDQIRSFTIPLGANAASVVNRYEYYSSGMQPSFRINRINSDLLLNGSIQATYLDLQYEYNSQGKISQIIRKPDLIVEEFPGPDSQRDGDRMSYLYDGRGRLERAYAYKSASGNNNVSATYGYCYNTLGNMTQAAKVAAYLPHIGCPSEGQRTLPLQDYCALGGVECEGGGQSPIGGESSRYMSGSEVPEVQAGPHAVKKVNDLLLSYNSNGSITNDGVRTYNYTADQQVREIRQGNKLLSVSFYGLQGQKVADIFYQNCTPNDGGGSNCSRSGLASGGLQLFFSALYSETITNLFSISVPGLGNVMDLGGTEQSIYGIFIKDHLGSLRRELDGSGNLVRSAEYSPYGDLESGFVNNSTRQGFNGRNAMPGGAYDYAARVMAPGLKRFLSADTIVQDPGDPQSYNRYAYVGNDPVNFVDPTGHTRVGGTGGPNYKNYGPRHPGFDDKGLDPRRVNPMKEIASDMGRRGGHRYPNGGEDIIDLSPRAAKVLAASRGEIGSIGRNGSFLSKAKTVLGTLGRFLSKLPKNLGLRSAVIPAAELYLHALPPLDFAIQIGSFVAEEIRWSREIQVEVTLDKEGTQKFGAGFMWIDPIVIKPQDGDAQLGSAESRRRETLSAIAQSAISDSPYQASSPNQAFSGYGGQNDPYGTYTAPGIGANYHHREKGNLPSCPFS